MLRRLGYAVLLSTAMLGGSPPLALAQQAATEDIFAPVTDPVAVPAHPPLLPPKVAKTTPAKVKTTTQAAKPTKADPAAAASAGSETDQRLGHLEEQIADIQVVLGTLESMGKGSPSGSIPAAGPAPAGGGDLDIRVGRLETQLQALSGQISDLANQIRAQTIGKQTTGALLPKAPTTATALAPLSAVTPQAQQSVLTSALGEQSANADTGFGQTTVTPGVDPAAAQMQPQTFDSPGQADVNGVTQTVVPDALPQADQQAGQVAAIAPEAPTNDPQAAYDMAYGHILQQDYAGAESAFREYLTRFPQAPLSSNAHYWLGQSFYARGQYKPAADAFLKGYKTYRTGQKAPDSLLKVAMSLSRLGQKDMACSAFTALDTEFPNTSVQVKHLAQTERERTGC